MIIWRATDNKQTTWMKPTLKSLKYFVKENKIMEIGVNLFWIWFCCEPKVKKRDIERVM